MKKAVQDKMGVFSRTLSFRKSKKSTKTQKQSTESLQQTRSASNLSEGQGFSGRAASTTCLRDNMGVLHVQNSLENIDINGGLFIEDDGTAVTTAQIHDTGNEETRQLANDQQVNVHLDHPHVDGESHDGSLAAQDIDNEETRQELQVNNNLEQALKDVHEGAVQDAGNEVGGHVAEGQQDHSGLYAYGAARNNMETMPSASTDASLVSTSMLNAQEGSTSRDRDMYESENILDSEDGVSSEDGYDDGYANLPSAFECRALDESRQDLAEEQDERLLQDLADHGGNAIAEMVLLKGVVPAEVIKAEQISLGLKKYLQNEKIQGEKIEWDCADGVLRNVPVKYVESICQASGLLDKCSKKVVEPMHQKVTDLCLVLLSGGSEAPLMDGLRSLCGSVYHQGAEPVVPVLDGEVDILDEMSLLITSRTRMADLFVLSPSKDEANSAYAKERWSKLHTYLSDDLGVSPMVAAGVMRTLLKLRRMCLLFLLESVEWQQRASNAKASGTEVVVDVQAQCEMLYLAYLASCLDAKDVAGEDNNIYSAHPVDHKGMPKDTMDRYLGRLEKVLKDLGIDIKGMQANDNVMPTALLDVARRSEINPGVNKDFEEDDPIVNGDFTEGMRQFYYSGISDCKYKDIILLAVHASLTSRKFVKRIMSAMDEMRVLREVEKADGYTSGVLLGIQRQHGVPSSDVTLAAEVGGEAQYFSGVLLVDDVEVMQGVQEDVRDSIYASDGTVLVENDMREQISKRAGVHIAQGVMDYLDEACYGVQTVISQRDKVELLLVNLLTSIYVNIGLRRKMMQKPAQLTPSQVMLHCYVLRRACPVVNSLRRGGVAMVDTSYITDHKGIGHFIQMATGGVVDEFDRRSVVPQEDIKERLIAYAREFGNMQKQTWACFEVMRGKLAAAVFAESMASCSAEKVCQEHQERRVSDYTGNETSIPDPVTLALGQLKAAQARTKKASQAVGRAPVQTYEILSIKLRDSIKQMYYDIENGYVQNMQKLAEMDIAIGRTSAVEAAMQYVPANATEHYKALQASLQKKEQVKKDDKAARVAAVGAELFGESCDLDALLTLDAYNIIKDKYIKGKDSSPVTAE